MPNHLMILMPHAIDRLVIAKLPVDLELFLDQLGQHRLIAAAVGFSNLRTEFALAALQAAMLERVQRAFYLCDQRRFTGMG